MKIAQEKNYVLTFLREDYQRDKRNPLPYFVLLMIASRPDGCSLQPGITIIPETAHTVLPTIEYVFRVSLPELSSFDQSGTGYGETSYLGAFLVLGKHSLITAARVIVGTSLGMLLGVFLGILMAWSPIVKKYLQPIVSFIRPIPLLALVPLFILWFGGKEAGNILYIVFGISVMVVVNTLNAIRNIPPHYPLFAETLGATRGQVFKTVIFPAIIPELIGGIKVALGMAWAITLGAEMLAAQQGLGRILILSQYFMYTGRMIIVVILFMLYSFILNIVTTRVGEDVIRWKPKLKEE